MFWVPVTVAVKGAVWPFVSEIQVGNSDMATGGCSVTFASITMPPVLLVAITVTVLVL